MMIPTDPGMAPRQAASPDAPPPALRDGNGSTPGDGSGSARGSSWQPAEGGPPSPPSVTLPKGGGAIRDIGEKFSVSAATGTAGLTVPIATSRGRVGFGPALSL